MTSEFGSISALDPLHARLRAAPFLHRFTAVTRLLLALSFIPSGLTKVLGQPFTALPTTNPVGYFFDAFFQAHEFYVFIGVAQLTAAVLLLIPRTALLGALLYFPIALNITVITTAMGFKGTWLIASLMTLGGLYLLFWDYERLKPLFIRRDAGRHTFDRSEYVREVVIWSAVGIIAYGAAALIGLANLWTTVGPAGFGVCAVAGALFGVAVAIHLRLESTNERAATSGQLATAPASNRK